MDAPLPLVTTELLTALVTAAGERLDANDAWLDLFGADALWGRLPLDDARFASDYVVEAARGGPVSHQVFLVDRSDGTGLATDLPAPVLLHFQPVRTPGVESGRFPVMLVGEVLREPVSWAAEQTRRRRLEMLGRMTMGVAHDFNNLLTTVLGHGELIRSDLGACGAPAESFAHLATLAQAAGDGAALVRRIQQYIRNDKQERAEPVALHELAAEVLTLTKPYWHNEPRRIGIAITVDADLHPASPILGTPTELREVLVNLVLNAVQAMPAGGTLGVATALAADGRGVTVEVSDTGVGMSDRVRRRIFEPLYTTKGTAGTGMGLTVSQGIVQEHNGRIEVESAVGRGTRFRLTFPFAAQDPAPVVASAATRATPAATPAAVPEPSGPKRSARPLRILVVDDEPMVRLVTTKLLRLRGHTVDDADGGAAALDALGGVLYDIVVTDLSMPGMSGRELAAEVRRRFPTLPVVLLTGDTDAQAEGSDVAAVVRKPFALDVLDAAVQQAVG